MKITKFSNAKMARMAVELDAASARKLVEAIQQVIQQAVAGGFLPGETK